MSPTARTMAKLKSQGVPCASVERWCSFSRRRIDCFGAIDIIALRDGILGIQTTSGSNVSARIAKMSAEPNMLAWVQNGGMLEVWGWSKRGARGKVKRWTVRIVKASVLPDGDKLLWNETGEPNAH